MTNSQRLATVRAHLRGWLSENARSQRPETPEQKACENSSDAPADIAAAESSITSESILIRDGFYSGRTFETASAGETFRATWFMEQDELKIQASSGEIVAVFQGDQITGKDEAAVEPEVQSPQIQGPISIQMPPPEMRPSPGRESGEQPGGISKAA
jgi:hypothetical protein